MKNRRDNFYMKVAIDAAQESHAIRAKVGAVITKDDNILSYGWNGMPSGMDNACEYEENGSLITRPECIQMQLLNLQKQRVAHKTPPFMLHYPHVLPVQT
jgi:dCMP deaminase